MNNDINTIKRVNSFNFVRLSVLFIIELAIFKSTIKSTSDIFAMFLGYIFTGFFIFSYFNYIENILDNIQKIEDNNVVLSKIYKYCELVDIKSIATVTMLFLLIVFYWIYFIRHVIIADSNVCVMILYYIISSISTSICINKLKLFLICINRIKMFIKISYKPDFIEDKNNEA